MGNFIVDGRRVFIPRTIVGGVPLGNDWTTFSGTNSGIFDIGHTVGGGFNAGNVDAVQYDATRILVAYSDTGSNEIRVVVVTVGGSPAIQATQNTVLTAHGTGNGSISIQSINGTQFLVTVGSGISTGRLRSSIVTFDGTTLTANTNFVDHPGAAGTAGAIRSRVKLLDSTTGVEIYADGSGNDFDYFARTFTLSLGSPAATASFSITPIGVGVSIESEPTTANLHAAYIQAVHVLDSDTLFVPIVEADSAVTTAWHTFIKLDSSTKAVQTFTDGTATGVFQAAYYGIVPMTNVGGSPTTYHLAGVAETINPTTFATVDYRGLGISYENGGTVVTDSNTVVPSTLGSSVGQGFGDLAEVVDVDQPNQFVVINTFDTTLSGNITVSAWNYDVSSNETTYGASVDVAATGAGEFAFGSLANSRAIEFEPGKIFFVSRAYDGVSISNDFLGAVVLELD